MNRIRAGVFVWALASAGVALAGPLMLKPQLEADECSDAELVRDRDDPDAACFVPRTCAECRTDAECDELCEVNVCKKPGESGCWRPERY